MSLFEELKRRNVFKVGVAYVIVAWLALQVADILLECWWRRRWIQRYLTSTPWQSTWPLLLKNPAPR